MGLDHDMLHFAELELNRDVSRGKVDVSVSSLFGLQRNFNFIILLFIFVSKVHQLSIQRGFQIDLICLQQAGLEFRIITV